MHDKECVGESCSLENRERRNLRGRFISLLLIVISTTFLSILGNIYFHELGHYFAAEHFDLNPTMHFTTGLDEGEGLFSVILSSDFKAFVRFDNIGRDWINLIVTFAGPAVNLMLTLGISFLYFFVVRRLKKNRRLFKKHFWNFLLLDAILLSALVPSILSFVINMSLINGSDGIVIYEMIRNIFLR